MSFMGEISQSIHIINSLQSLTDVSYFKAFGISSDSYLSPRPKKVPPYVVFFVMGSALSCGID